MTTLARYLTKKNITYASLACGGLANYYYSADIATYVLNKLDAEKAHNLSIFLMSKNIIPYTKTYNSPVLHNEIMGHKINHPVGLAAGFDKNALAYNQLYKIGFSSVEIGSVTPNIQKGNKKPRIFREEDFILNHCGLNNHGINIVKQRLSYFDCEKRKKNNNILGISISKNNDSKKEIEDFLTGIDKLQDYGDYIVLNLSCPNVKKKVSLNTYEEIFKKTRDKCYKPLFIKLSPDLEDDQYLEIGKQAIKHKINGIVLTNTLKTILGGESGSEKLYERSNLILKNMYKEFGSELIFVGCGGILTPEQAYKKIKLGASMIQIYSGFIYSGPNIIYDINKYLDEQLKKDGFKNIKQAIGADV